MAPDGDFIFSVSAFVCASSVSSGSSFLHHGLPSFPSLMLCPQRQWELCLSVISGLWYVLSPSDPEVIHGFICTRDFVLWGEETGIQAATITLLTWKF